MAKETDRKVSKLNEQLMEKTSENKKLDKTINEQKIKAESFEC